MMNENLSYQMMFDRMMMNATVSRLLSYITGNQRHQAIPHAAIDFRVDRGIQTICIGKIRGSVNKTHDFDVDFNPLSRHSEKRWIGIAAAMDKGEPLPPIEVIKVDETYYVVDGHHRVSAAHALHYDFLDAHVIEMRLAS